MRPENGSSGRKSPAPTDSLRYCSRPPVYTQRSLSFGFSTSSVTSSPGQSTAFARSTCLSRGSEICGLSKYLGFGQNRTVVPVLFFATLPTTSSLPRGSPPPENMLFFFPPRPPHRP